MDLYLNEARKILFKYEKEDNYVIFFKERNINVHDNFIQRLTAFNTKYYKKPPYVINNLERIADAIVFNRDIDKNTDLYKDYYPLLHELAASIEKTQKPFRDKSIELNLTKILPKDFATIIIKYDYYIGGISKVRLEGYNSIIWCIEELPDGSIITGHEDGIIKIWDLKTGWCRLTLKCRDKVKYIKIIPQNKIVSGSEDNLIKVWDLLTGECILTIDNYTPINGLLVLPNGFIVSNYGDSVVLYDIKDGELDNSSPEIGTVSCMELLPDGNILVGFTYGDLLLWNFKLNAKVPLHGHGSRIISIVSLPENKALSIDVGGTIFCWNLNTRKYDWTISSKFGVIFMIVVPDKILVGYADGSLIFWNINTQQIEFTRMFKGLDGIERLLDERVIIKTGYGVAQILDMNAESILTLEKDWKRIHIKVLKDGRTISALTDGSLRIWE